jgi:hypothetical protein
MRSNPSFPRSLNFLVIALLVFRRLEPDAKILETKKEDSNAPQTIQTFHPVSK